MIRRREFLARAAAAGALVGLPWPRAQRVLEVDAPPLPPADLQTTDPARYWAELRRQWLLTPDHINLNCGSVGCTPLPVLRAMIEHVLYAEEYREPEYPWFGYEEDTRLNEVRTSMAAFLHVDRDELALVRNATEANNVVANGLDLKPGDEVLLTDQEHPGGLYPWQQKAQRYGVKLNTVALPKPPASTEEIVERFENALTPKTQIIVFSHITTMTGVVLPAKEICAMARKRSVLTHVDGAHAIGQIPLNLSDIGCDFYGSSPHKWLMAPKGTGTLYIRQENLDRLWVNIATANSNNKELKAYRFSWFGTSNLSVMVGLKAALDFYAALGPERIYARAHELAGQVRGRVANYPQLKIVNASGDQFYGGMVCFEPVIAPTPAAAVAAAAPAAGATPAAVVPTAPGLKKVAEECAKRQIRIAGGEQRMRISTHIFTQPTELNKFYDALDVGMRA
jgi:isopenicillin-N epimerase